MQRKKPIDFTKKEFFNFSYDFKSFLSALLAYDWGERYSASQALSHPWLKSLMPSMTFKKLTLEVFQRTKTNQNLSSKLNINLLNFLVSVARGIDRKQMKRRSHSISGKLSYLRTVKTK